MKYLKLSDNYKIPILGFGTYKLQADNCTSLISDALKIGYRHIDTADRYGNHKCIGSAIKSSQIKREELFLTSKVWYTNLSYQEVIDTCYRTIDELQSEYLDLFLIHWPNSKIPIQETLDALVHLKSEGAIKNIGVSNFSIEDLKITLSHYEDIVMNQVEYHPSYTQTKMHKYCKKHNLQLTAYSPLGQGHDLDIHEIVHLSGKYNKSPAQIILNWLISKDIIVIPRADSKFFLQDNFDVLQWNMSKDDIAIMDGLNKKNKIIKPDYSGYVREHK